MSIGYFKYFKLWHTNKFYIEKMIFCPLSFIDKRFIVSHVLQENFWFWQFLNISTSFLQPKNAFKKFILQFIYIFFYFWLHFFVYKFQITFAI